MKSAAIFTLGCKVNQYESESVAAQLVQAGYKIVDWHSEADLYVVHTCAVTAQAAAKSRQQIHQAHRKNPQAQIVVMGCYAQLESETIAEMPGVRFVVGTTDRQAFLEKLSREELFNENDQVRNFVRAFQESESFEEMKGLEQADYSRPMIKIQEGCNNYCSYCIIPYLRGPERSRSLKQIVTEAKGLVEQGYHELVLTGIHLSAWGKDFQIPQHITTLLKAIIDIEGLQRLRVSSVEPTDIDSFWIDFMASQPKFCRHLHIPLQSGCDTVLKRMNRKYDTEMYRQLIRRLRERIPSLAITTDVIVGFPAESEEEAQATFQFCREMNFSRMHVFRFSARKGTMAAKLPLQLAKNLQECRSQALRDLGNNMAEDFAKSFLGKEIEVLLEANSLDQGFAEGYSQEYVRVRVPFTEPIDKGGILIRVKAMEITSQGLVGIPIH
jgi:threonylcarbamoyladenosine tRNA methylthiotransferase MtaB